MSQRQAIEMVQAIKQNVENIIHDSGIDRGHPYCKALSSQLDSLEVAVRNLEFKGDTPVKKKKAAVNVSSNLEDRVDALEQRFDVFLGGLSGAVNEASN